MILVGTDEGIAAIGGALPGAPDQGIAHLARGGGATWALTDEGEAWLTDGRSWQHLATIEGLQARCILPGPASAWVGTAEARIAEVRRDGARWLGAFDAAPGREAWYTPWGGPPDVRSMAADAGGTRYVNVHVGGILRSDDEGETWVPTLDMDLDVHQVVVAPSGEVLAASAYGLLASDDAGASWETLDAGLHAPYSRAVAASEAVILVSASRGPRGGEARLYRWNGAGFEECLDGLPDGFEHNIDTHCVAIEDRLCVFGTGDGDVFQSLDAGGTWEQVAQGLGAIRAVLIA